MSKILLTAMLVMAGFALLAQDSDKPTFTIGSEVSDYPAVQWVKGTPVTQFDKNKIYIVECWATWCGPCVQSIPHLNELSKKYGDKIVFIGQNVWEDGKDVVEKFVKEQGDGMSYNVAFSGGKESEFVEKWLTPAKVNGIPHTFVIQDNKIVWQPHPMSLSEEALQMLIDRKFTVAAAEAFDPIKKMEEVRKLIEENKLEEADAKLGALLDKDPNSGGLAYSKVNLLKKQGKKAEALAFAKKYYDKNPDQGRRIYFEEMINAEQYDQLLPLIDQAMIAKPKDLSLIILRYNVLSKKKDPKGAEAMIRKMSNTSDEMTLMVLSALNNSVEDGLTDPAVEKAMLDAGVKALSISPGNIKSMISVAGIQWKMDKAAAKATVAKTIAALKADPRQANMVDFATQIQASMDKDVFPNMEQIEAFYDAAFNKK